jgi:hypothetical protein
MWIAETLLQAIGRDMGPDGCVTAERMAELTGWQPGRVNNAVEVLKRNELLTTRSLGCYRLTEAGVEVVEGRARPRLKSGPKGKHGASRAQDEALGARIWRALRILGKASLPDLMEIADSKGSRSEADHARRYLRALADAGYLRELRREPGTHKRWLLVRDTGPQAPVPRSAWSELRDPNTGAVHVIGRVARG